MHPGKNKRNVLTVYAQTSTYCQGHIKMFMLKMCLDQIGICVGNTPMLKTKPDVVRIGEVSVLRGVCASEMFAVGLGGCLY